jgi:site-specific recombinase XerD
MLDALELRGMAVRTREIYIDAVARLARHYGQSPDTLTAEQVQAYLLHLLRERHLSRSTVNQCSCACRFLYGTVLGLDGRAFQIPLAPAPQRLPEILSREELQRLFAAACHLKARTFLMVGLWHGAARVRAVPPVRGRHRQRGRPPVHPRRAGQGRQGPLRAAGG